MAGVVYVADTSVYVLRDRHEQVRRRFDSLMLEGRLAACQMAAIEFLNNAPDPASYRILAGVLEAQRWLDVTTAAMDRALHVHWRRSATIGTSACPI